MKRAGMVRRIDVDYLKSLTADDDDAPLAVIPGVFDVLHPGNLFQINEAVRECSSVAILLIDDEICRKYRGWNPVHDMTLRLKTVCSIKNVDYVCPVSQNIEKVFHALLNSKRTVEFRMSMRDPAGDFLQEISQGQIRGKKIIRQDLNNARRTEDYFREFRIFSDGFVSRNDLEKLCRSVRESGKRIVSTNGCFDIIHPGHVLYLEKASALGDVLIVSINGDASVRQFKGAGRPVHREMDRVKTLLGLRSVDYVTIFDEDDSLAVLSRIKPDFHVKGGTFIEKRIQKEKNLVESFGGVMKTYAVEKQGSIVLSTTRYINQASRLFDSHYENNEKNEA